jgi:4'-phosphopantetheinyl transferase
MLALSGRQLRECVREYTRECAPGHLDLWLLSTLISDPDRPIYDGVLTPEERQRAGRFHFDADRNRFMAGRGGLRWILSLYCGIPPEVLTFETGPHGKPELPPFPALSFNVSHSGEYVLIAVTTGTNCGVDIECKRRSANEEGIAQRFFCPREVEWLRRTKDGFLRLWTAKEAIIKAVGGGLSIPLTDVDVTDFVEGKTLTVNLEISGQPAQRLWLQELALVEGYWAAVAVTGERIAIHRMPEE